MIPVRGMQRLATQCLHRCSLDDEELNELSHFCEDCVPEDHEEYLEALKRGEELWQTE